MAVLTIDVGNTRLKWALFNDLIPEAAPLEAGAEFLENIERLSDAAWAQLRPPAQVIACTVAGDAVRRRVDEQLELWTCKVHWVVASAAVCGVANGYDHPSRLGVDRWVALIGARGRLLRRSLRQPALIVLVGTAVTVEALDDKGVFLGGFILPGHGIMLKALEAGTAGLHVPTGEVTEFPTNTSDALTSGGTYAIAGAVERMAQHIENLCGMSPSCFITGGAAWKMLPHMSRPFQLVENLILDGLLEIGLHMQMGENYPAWADQV